MLKGVAAEKVFCKVPMIALQKRGALPGARGPIAGSAHKHEREEVTLAALSGHCCVHRLSYILLPAIQIWDKGEAA